MRLRIEFLGGLDTVVDGQRQHDINVELYTMADLVRYVHDIMIKSKHDRETFLTDHEQLQVRPGIIVLINDTDWELEGGLEYALVDGDVISFTSTLHGG